ncbi:MAG: hypothetical protein PVG07_13755, partial [Acidobacteriota bacterium]
MNPGTTADQTRHTALDWWVSWLQGLPDALDLPADRPRPPILGAGRGRVASKLPGASSARETRGRETVGIDELLAGVAAFVHRAAGADRFALASSPASLDPDPTPDRTPAEASEDPAPEETELLPLPFDLADDPRFGD